MALALIPASAFAASLSPSVMELSAQRGEVVEQTLTVINTRAIEQTYFLGVMKFEPQEEGGSPAFIPYEEDHTGLPEWIALPFTEFRVPPQAKGDVPFRIAVPNDVKAGGYYAAMTVSQAPSDLVESNGAIVEAKTAALILLTVEGDTTEKLELLDFVGPTGMESSLSHTVTYRVQNQGNVHVMPKGTIELRDLLGRVLKVFDANPEQGRILPGSTRSYQVGEQNQEGFFETLKTQMRTFAIGPIEVKLTLTYGVSEQSINTEMSFWYVPWQLLVSALIVLVICLKLFTRRS